MKIIVEKKIHWYPLRITKKRKMKKGLHTRSWPSESKTTFAKAYGIKKTKRCYWEYVGERSKKQGGTNWEHNGNLMRTYWEMREHEKNLSPVLTVVCGHGRPGQVCDMLPVPEDNLSSMIYLLSNGLSGPKRTLNCKQ
jgi:hypothetical protein